MSYGVDTNWYVDSGATNHFTNALEKVTMSEKYHGQDQVHNANGEGMEINHIGHAIVKTPSRNIHLRNILHVPKTEQKKLLSVHRIALDNKVFLEFHPYFFLIRDQVTRNILYRGRCVHGLYPLIPHFRSFNKVFDVVKLSSKRWHARLEHPSFVIVQQVLRNNKLPCVGERRSETICDSCQRAKAHQLPYPVSTSVSTKPLQLIFSDVWGPAPTSVGRHD